MDIDQILPKLFVGSSPIDEEDIDRLKEESGITAILNVQTEEDFDYWNIDWPKLESHYQRNSIKVRRVPVRDFSPESLRKFLPDCVEALGDLLREGHSVFVHCNAGMNRSPSTIIAYLHWVEGWGLGHALDHVMKRHCCDPYMDVIELATEDRRRGGVG